MIEGISLEWYLTEMYCAIYLLSHLGVASLVYIIEDGDMEDVLLEKLTTPVKEIMTKRNILSVSPDDDFETALRSLSRHHYKKLPVINDAGRVVGVLSRGDVIDSISKNIICRVTNHPTRSVKVNIFSKKRNYSQIILRMVS